MKYNIVLIILIIFTYSHVKSFYITKGIIVNNNNYSKSKLLMGASVATQKAFNPFTNREKSSRTIWFEAELASFYDFVEKQPLLSADEELQYGKAVAMWNKIKKLASDATDSETVAKMSTEEIAKAARLPLETVEKTLKYDSIAMNKLINSNLKLVLAVVSRYRSSNIANSELISEGTKGLAKAAARYDYSKGYRFATYATWYVHQAVSEYVRWRKHPAKMPSRYLLLMRKVRQFSSDYKEIHGTSPTIAEISEKLGQSHYDVVKILNMQTFPLLTSNSIQTTKDTSNNNNQGKQILEQVLTSNQEPIITCNQENLRRNIETLMSDSLNDIERKVLRLRLGFDDGKVKPMKEVGKEFHISWKQVRKVEKCAIDKLLENEKFSDFADSLNDNYDITTL